MGSQKEEGWEVMQQDSGHPRARDIYLPGRVRQGWEGGGKRESHHQDRAACSLTQHHLGEPLAQHLPSLCPSVPPFARWAPSRIPQLPAW